MSTRRFAGNIFSLIIGLSGSLLYTKLGMYARKRRNVNSAFCIDLKSFTAFSQERKDSRALLRLACLSCLIAFSLIWRTRSLVTPKISPISSSVIGSVLSRP
jgi:hypothetical protein